MWSAYIYKAFYVLLHCAFTIFEIVCRAIEYVRSKFVDFCHEFLLITDRNKYLQKQVHISKTPAHLTVILGPEQPSYKDLASLVLWCLANRINFISFYDHKGTLKKNEDKLQCEVQRRKLKEDHVIWHTESDSAYKNGFIGRKIHVKVITEEDGRQGVVNLIKNYSLTKKSDDVNIVNISQDLREQFEFPDPDLGFVCGKTFNLYDYPPWQIRVTEFLHIKSHHNITLSSFLEQLSRYSRCEQRLGK